MNFAFRNPGHQAATVKSITPLEARKMAENGAILLDVREHGEIAMSGKAKGAVHIPNPFVPMFADPRHPDHDPRLSPEKPVIVYCAAGGRAQMAAENLVRLGYGEVYNMGGFSGWFAAGGEVE